MTRPGPPPRVTATGITGAPKPELRPYTWRGVPGPVIGTPREIRARDDEHDDEHEDGDEQA